MYTSNQQLLKKLQAFTRACRPDMHEPDEQGITATVRGKVLDNAYGNTPDGIGHEYIVTLQQENGSTLSLNLATLIALARCADEAAVRRTDGRAA